jgi:hypothetical protein
MPDRSGGDVRRPMPIHGTAQNKERDMCLGQGDGRGWGHDVLLYLMLFLPLLLSKSILPFDMFFGI